MTSTPRIYPPEPAALEAVRVRVGDDLETNMERAMAHAPEVLGAYLAFEDALVHGSLRPRLREQIAITIAEANGCLYCLSAHLAAARNFHLDEDELERNRRGQAEDPRTHAVLRFVRAVVTARGDVDDEELERIRADGFTDADVIELVAEVALNTFTNYFNRLARPVIDFPVAERGR